MLQVILAALAAACVRSAAGTLLKLPGARESGGLQAAAQDLLDAVRPPASGAADNSSAPTGLAAVGPVWDRVAGAATVLRGELERPGGYPTGAEPAASSSG
ncbi:hypothetical protein [Streptomyces sp. NPDC003877]